MREFAAECIVALALMAGIQIFLAPSAVADSSLRPQTSDSTSKTKQYKSVIEFRSDTEGVDFGPYLRPVYLSVKRKWTEMIMPESAKQGERGIVTIQFHIQQDGKVPDDSVKVVFSSGKKDMDDACLTIVRTAGPFEHLPETFHSPFIELRMTFHFNVSNAPQ